jgi:predicted amidophosphoribosyltransferase
MDTHSIVINNIAPEGSVCEICGRPAPWQMYCKDCGHVLRFYCDEHAFLSQGNEMLEKQVKNAKYKKSLKTIKQLEEAQIKWKNY